MYKALKSVFLFTYNYNPTHILKDFESVYIKSLTDCINNCILTYDFPDFLKVADITPCFKKGDPTDKSNYRPISILPAISKIYEKILFKQILSFIEPKLNSLLCGFRKKYSTQHALLLLQENAHLLMVQTKHHLPYHYLL